MWLDFSFNTSLQLTRHIHSALLPITINQFIDSRLGEFGSAVTVRLRRGCSCDLCEPGSYTGVSGPTACQLCAPGNFSAARGMSNCALCSEDTFVAEFGSSVCTDGPAWAFSQPGKSSCRVRAALLPSPFVVQIPLPSPFVEQISLGSPLPPSAFTLEVQGLFRAAMQQSLSLA